MLILTRRLGETLIADDVISITVLDVQGNQVRLGVKAPREVEVHREEVYRRIQEEKRKNRRSSIEQPQRKASSAREY